MIMKLECHHSRLTSYKYLTVTEELLTGTLKRLYTVWRETVHFKGASFTLTLRLWQEVVKIFSIMIWIFMCNTCQQLVKGLQAPSMLTVQETAIHYSKLKVCVNETCWMGRSRPRLAHQPEDWTSDFLQNVIWLMIFHGLTGEYR
jgi:hypothetical protein